MKKTIIFTLSLLFTILVYADNRGLWACKNINGSGVFVSWRMRSTDDPLHLSCKGK